MQNSHQIDYWNGRAGTKWAQHANQLDALLAPFAEAVLEAAALKPGNHVLDIGCGAGALTLKAADRVGPAGKAVGLDVSEPLLRLARKRADPLNLPVRFVQADASIYQAEPKCDALISRFGVMFFDDPVAAFSGLRKNLRPGGRISFACWQSLMVNDWAYAPLAAARPFLPDLPAPPPPGTPGPFAFADKDLICSILSEAGWLDIHIRSWNDCVTLPGETPAEAARFMLKIGPVARLITEAGTDLSQVETALTYSLSQQVGSNGRVLLPAAAWIVSAQAG